MPRFSSPGCFRGQRLGLGEDLTDGFGQRRNRGRRSHGDEAQKQGILDEILSSAVAKQALEKALRASNHRFRARRPTHEYRVAVLGPSIDR